MPPEESTVQPFLWALRGLGESVDPQLVALRNHVQAEKLSQVLQAAHRFAFGSPANKDLVKQRRAFDRRLKGDPREAIAALYELMVLAALRCRMCSLEGIEAKGKGATHPDFDCRTLTEQPFVVEVKTLFRGDNLLQYEPNLESFRQLLFEQLGRRRHRLVNLDVFAGPSEIPHSAAEIRACIKGAERVIRAARSKGNRFCASRTPSGASICVELEGAMRDVPGLFGRKLQEIDEMRDRTTRSLAEQRRGLVAGGDEVRDSSVGCDPRSEGSSPSWRGRVPTGHGCSPCVLVMPISR